MKILIVARPWSFHGGVETATAGLLRALAERGHDVHVLSTGPQRSLPGVTVHRLGVPPLPPAARVLAVASLARRAIAGGRWDLVQSHERVLGADVYRAGEGCHRAYLAALACGDDRRRPRGRPLYHRAVLALERRVFARTPHVVAIAERGKDEIERLYGVAPDRVSVVYNGVDLERFHLDTRAAHRDQARTEAGLDGHAYAWLFVGSGYERKGLGTAIRALAKHGDPRARLLVVGKGDAARYRALAADAGVAERVVWLGAREDIERWYAAADVLLLPARYEPFGNVHLEALASGVPVVTSTMAGGAEVIVEGVNGAVRDPDDVVGIADAVHGLAARPRMEMADACRLSAEPFTYAHQVQRLEGIWRGVMGRKP